MPLHTSHSIVAKCAFNVVVAHNPSWAFTQTNVDTEFTLIVIVAFTDAKLVSEHNAFKTMMMIDP
jgi:hypothetical protein